MLYSIVVDGVLIGDFLMDDPEDAEDYARVRDVLMRNHQQIKVFITKVCESEDD